MLTIREITLCRVALWLQLERGGALIAPEQVAEQRALLGKLNEMREDLKRAR